MVHFSCLFSAGPRAPIFKVGSAFWNHSSAESVELISPTQKPNPHPNFEDGGRGEENISSYRKAMLAVAPLAYHDDWRNNFRQQSDKTYVSVFVSVFCLPSGLAYH